jgi:crotonobetainyl-CoA:carnitine CoA-transferase CaiB-like acyl-CoA transferase
MEKIMLTKGALQGVTVLDLSRMLPGPYCSMILADHGAEVIAIEGRNFQGESLFFNDQNRNKRHMSLNLKTKEGLEIFYKLVQKADVIIEGFRPGVVKRLGIDYPSVKKVKNDIIYCSISGYGQTGELTDLAGHDVNYLSRSGILGLLGTRSGPPSIPGVQFADIAGGSMNAAVGILLALYARERDGEGQYIDISMTDGMVGFLTLPYYFSKKSGRLPEPSNSLLSHRYGCYNTYETSDKRFISIGAVEGVI